MPAVRNNEMVIADHDVNSKELVVTNHNVNVKVGHLEAEVKDLKTQLKQRDDSIKSLRVACQDALNHVFASEKLRMRHPLQTDSEFEDEFKLSLAEVKNKKIQS